MFCPECGALMKPSGDEWVCKKCGAAKKRSDEDDDKITTEKEEEKKMVVIEKEESTQPKTKVRCPNCDNNEAYWRLEQTRAADEPETRIYRCTECDHRWREY